MNSTRCTFPISILPILYVIYISFKASASLINRCTTCSSLFDKDNNVESILSKVSDFNFSK